MALHKPSGYSYAALALPFIRLTCSCPVRSWLTQLGHRRWSSTALQGELAINFVGFIAGRVRHPSFDFSPYLHWSACTTIVPSNRFIYATAS